MINYDSILSAFDGKPTLLQWLKMVKKALDESVLKNVDIAQNGEKVVFSFNFEDGTSISTPEVNLPKGDKGDKGGDGVGIVRIETSNSQVVGNDTETTIRVELSDGTINNFKAYAKNGINGNDGVSITGINTVGSEVAGDETLTTLRANYSDNTTGDFVVKAKNGKDATSGGKIYSHSIIIGNAGSLFIFFNVYSSKENITLEDALSQLPTSGGIPVVFSDSNIDGVLSAKREISTGNGILLKGLVYNSSNSSTQLYSGGFIAATITDTLLGENL